MVTAIVGLHENVRLGLLLSQEEFSTAWLVIGSWNHSMAGWKHNL